MPIAAAAVRCCCRRSDIPRPGSVGSGGRGSGSTGSSSVAVVAPNRQFPDLALAAAAAAAAAAWLDVDDAAAAASWLLLSILQILLRNVERGMP
jgi:hypothetical protein